MGNQQSSTQMRTRKHEESTTNTEILNSFKLISDNEEVINFNQFKVFLKINLFKKIFF